MVNRAGKDRWRRPRGWGWLWSLVLTIFFSMAQENLFGVEKGVDGKKYVPTQADVVIGCKDAPVRMVEFSSFTCLHCAEFHEKIYKKLYEAYIASGLVDYVMVPFPMDAIALRAVQLAQAQGLDSYPNLADLIFSKQKEWLFSKNPFESLEKLLLKAGVKFQDIKKALENKEWLHQILQRSLKVHKELGVNKTPTFLINGEIIEGAEPFETFEKLIKKELDKVWSGGVKKR